MVSENDFGLAIFRPSIYKFLHMARWKDVEKKVLDCGAGDNNPPLALFSKHGYEVYGIDISDNALDEERNFAKH